MARIHHVHYMPKKYGGSETLVSMIANLSKHEHSIGYAKGSSPISNVPFYVRTVNDFREYFSRRVDGDIVHAHFVFAGVPSQLAGNKTVCSSHCLFSEEFKLAAHDAKDKSEERELMEGAEFFAGLEKQLYPKARNLIVHSNFHKAELRQLGADARFIELPLEISRFDIGITKKQAKEKLGIPNRFTLLFLGRPTYLKGFSVLAEAFRTIKDKCQLVVVGDFNIDESRLSYTPCVRASDSNVVNKSFNLGSNVFAFPPTDNNKIPLYFNAADALVCPSLYESLGYVNLEAMAAMTPVIGSNVAGIPFIVEDNKTGLLFEPGNANDLTTKIRKLMGSPKLRIELTKNARSFVEQFDAGRIAAKYDELYGSILEARNG
jgi:glycosyltransferase involved in cell wall biosynthesis